MQKLLLIFYEIVAYILSQIWKILPNMVFPPIWGKKWRRSEHAHASYPRLFFRTPGFSPYMRREERRVQGLDYVLKKRKNAWVTWRPQVECFFWQSTTGASKRYKLHLLSFHFPSWANGLVYVWTQFSVLFWKLLGSPMSHAEYWPANGVPSIQ